MSGDNKLMFMFDKVNRTLSAYDGDKVIDYGQFTSSREAYEFMQIQMDKKRVETKPKKEPAKIEAEFCPKCQQPYVLTYYTDNNTREWVCEKCGDKKPYELKRQETTESGSKEVRSQINTG